MSGASCSRTSSSTSRNSTRFRGGGSRPDIGWPDIRYDKFRPLPHMSQEMGWLRVIVPSDVRELSWHYEHVGALDIAAQGLVPLEPPGIVRSPTEIFRDDWISIHLVPSNDVLAGAWAVPPSPTG